MLRIVEDLIHGAALADAARVHHDDLVAHVGDDAQVVRNHDDGHAQLLLQVLHQFQNLRLNGHVQSRGGLVGNQDIRLARQSHGDHHALAHASGQLVRILLEALLRLVHAHELEHLHGAGVGLLMVAVGVQQNGLAQLVADGVGGVEGGHRVLEDDGDALAAELAHLLFGKLHDVLTVKEDFAALDAAGLHQNAHDGIGRHALAAAGLAHDAQHPALVQAEGNPVDGADLAGVHVKRSTQVFYLQQRCAHSFVTSSAWGRRRRAGRRPAG